MTLFISELYERDFQGRTAIYWEVKYPFPLSNRDVSFPPPNVLAPPPLDVLP